MWKGGSEQQSMTPDPGDPGDPLAAPDECQIVQKPHVFTAKVTRVTLRCNVLLTVSYPSHQKHLVLRVSLEDCLPEMLSKLGV